MKVRQFAVGDMWKFKPLFATACYGRTAIITAIRESVDRPHPGYIHHTWIDLTTDTGIRLQWSPAMLRRRAT